MTCPIGRTLSSAIRPTVAGHVNAGEPAWTPPGLQAAATWLAENFARLVEEHGVPGATIAVLAGGEVATAAGGVTSLATQVPVDAETVFQIGSITKIWTTTLVLQLVDDGLLDLDQPLLDYLPELVIGDMEAAKAAHHASPADPHRRLRGRHLHRHRPR